MCKGTEDKTRIRGLVWSLAPAAEKGVLGEPEETTGEGLLCPQAEGMGVGGVGTAPSQSLLLGRAGGGRRPSLARLCAQGLGTACLDHTEQCPWMCSAASLGSATPRTPPQRSPRVSQAAPTPRLLLRGALWRAAAEEFGWSQTTCASFLAFPSWTALG